MKEEKKFYYIKLMTDFFAENSPIDYLLSQKNGSEYVVLYLKLCLLTANTEGKLITLFNEVLIPYDVEKITRDMKFFSVDTVRVALTLYKKLGLIYESNEGVLVLVKSGISIGTESASKEAIKKRNYREKNKDKLLGTYTGTNKGTNCPTEYRDKSIENRDKILDIKDTEYKYINNTNNIKITNNSKKAAKAAKENEGDENEKLPF